VAAFFLEVADGQIYQFGRGIIGWKAATGFGGFPDYPVQALNRVGGIDDFAHVWWERKERDDLLPRPSPTRRNGGVFLAPFFLECVQCFGGGFIIYGLVNDLQTLCYFLALFPAAEVQGVAHKMHNTGLDHRSGPWCWCRDRPR